MELNFNIEGHSVSQAAMIFGGFTAVGIVVGIVISSLFFKN